MDQAKKSQATNAESHDGFSDKKTRNKIVKHLSDINDTISDEDIKNVITDISSGGDEEKIQLDTNTPLNKDSIIPDDESNQLPSWNINE